jgi:ABC-type multidrug transport system fused ATPase/permease subunit
MVILSGLYTYKNRVPCYTNGSGVLLRARTPQNPDKNNMNAVERMVHYSKEVEQEVPFEIPANKPPLSWPAEGRIEFSNVTLKYRPELPAVLKGISFSVNTGEKVGIVGR